MWNTCGTGFVWFGRVDLSEVLIAFWSHNDFIRQIFIVLKSKVGFFVDDSVGSFLRMLYLLYIYYRNQLIHVGKYTVRPMDPSWATLRTAKNIFSFWSQWSAKSDLFGTNLTILYNGRNPPNQLRLVVYPIIYRVSINPRWCRISSINSIRQKWAGNLTYPNIWGLFQNGRMPVGQLVYNVNTGETTCYQIPKVRETFPGFFTRSNLVMSQPKELRFINLHQLQIWLVVATHLKKSVKL